MKYEDSGVDIERANRAMRSISRHVKATWGKEVLSETGAFGGLFSVGGSYEDPVLVSSIDGVGTKVLVAGLAGRFDTVGRDLVNHCVNDIIVQGARPLFFLDYVASGRLDPVRVASIIEGLALACQENRCALIGGETAEMPGVYRDEDFDLAGCIVGVVEKRKIIDGSTIAPGDAVLGLASTGLHTNGFSLARKILFDELSLGIDAYVGDLGCTVGEELLKVHASYLEPVTRMMEKATVKGIAHITGGGIIDNLPRILPGNCDAEIRAGTWPVPPVFQLLQTQGAVPDREMFQVFNMGIGMVLVVSAEDKDKLLNDGAGDAIRLIGEIKKGTGEVAIA